MLATLRETTHQLFDATTKAEMSHIAVDAAREVLAFPIMGIHLYNASTGSLQPVAGTTEATELFDGLPTFSETGTPSIAWRVFAEGEPVYMDDVTTEDDVYNTETPIRSEMILPLGDHGVMIIGLLERDAFTDEDIEFAELLAMYVESAFDRTDRTQQLREHQREVQYLVHLMTLLGNLFRRSSEYHRNKITTIAKIDLVSKRGTNGITKTIETIDTNEMRKTSLVNVANCTLELIQRTKRAKRMERCGYGV